MLADDGFIFVNRLAKGTIICGLAKGPQIHLVNAELGQDSRRYKYSVKPIFMGRLNECSCGIQLPLHQGSN